MKSKIFLLFLGVLVLPFLSFSASAEGEYKLVFSDEFDGAEGSMPDASKWVRCPRYSSTWNRWLSKNDDEHALTGFISDGHFVARAVPNPYTATDDVPMITGGIKSMGKFCFRYGKVECRLKTNPYSGNFPALWMMPENQSFGWPSCGEIDIWEAINTESLSYHTIHSHWTYDLGNKTNPTSSFTHYASQYDYHIYGFEWDDNTLKWYVDDTLVGTYTKSSNQSVLDQGQWPFDKNFHLILNQSVGDGSWAYNADTNHTYETVFDWIRVYQKEEPTNSRYCGADWGNADSYPARHLNSLVLSGDVSGNTTITGFDNTNAHAVFNDCTDKIVRANAGATINLKPTSDSRVAWIHGYVYIDYNNDGEFTPSINTSTGLVNADSELVAYSYYGVNDANDLVGFDSAGNRYEGGESANRAGSLVDDGRIPAFKLPDDLADGNYRMRFKMDWNCIDPCGNQANDNRTNEIGGYIIDFTLQVGNTSDLDKVETTEKLYYANGSIYTNVEGKIKIYDLNGKLMKQSDFAPVDVTTFAKGVYVVKSMEKL